MFAVITGLEGISYVRLPNGEWVKAWPGMSLWQEVPGSPDIKDPKANHTRHAVDEKFAKVLENELARLRRDDERGVS